MKKVLYILGQLEDSDLQWLLDAGEARRVTAGELLIEQGKEILTLFLVIQGELSVHVAGQEAEVARVGAGEIVGEMSMLDSRPPNATVKAFQAATVLAVPHDRLQRQLDRDPGFAARFYRALCIFLANRLSRTTAMVGREQPRLEQDVQEEDEISPEALEGVAMAGARFDWLRRQVLGG